MPFQKGNQASKGVSEGKTGRPKDLKTLYKEAWEEIRDKTPELLKSTFDIATGATPGCTPKDQLMAIKLLIEHTKGKPKETIEHIGDVDHIHRILIDRTRELPVIDAEVKELHD